jgi:hypothetical protein
MSEPGHGRECGWAAKEVNALAESEKFRLIEAFSAQMAHWSFGRDQYFPRLSFAGLSASVGKMPRAERTLGGRAVEGERTFTKDARRLRRRRMLRAVITGSRKRRNSCGFKYDAEDFT